MAGPTLMKCTAFYEIGTGSLSKREQVEGGVTSTAGRTGGWSEQFYFNPLGAFQVQFETYLEKRCQGLLTTSGVCVKQRYQQINPRGPTKVVKKQIFGGQRLTTDIPQMAVLVQLNSVDGANRRNQKFKGIPDDWVVAGELSSAVNLTPALTQIAQVLGGGFRFRGVNQSNPQFDLLSVTAGGLATTIGNHTLVAGDYVQVKLTLNANRDRKGFKTTVIAPVTGNTLTLKDWTLGDCTRGSVRVYEIVYPAISLAVPEGPLVCEGKIGRPSRTFVGRRSRRR